MFKAIPPLLILITVAAIALPIAAASDGAKGNESGPAYTVDGRLIPLEDYHHWVFLTSDFGVSFRGSADHPPFANVFVDPAAYRIFRKTGT